MSPGCCFFLVGCFILPHGYPVVPFAFVKKCFPFNYSGVFVKISDHVHGSIFGLKSVLFIYIYIYLFMKIPSSLEDFW